MPLFVILCGAVLIVVGSASPSDGATVAGFVLGAMAVSAGVVLALESRTRQPFDRLSDRDLSRLRRGMDRSREVSAPRRLDR
jgi:hypothetical protein